MLSDSDIEKSVKTVMENIVPAVNDRTWLVEYLYKHKIGNRLPRGKKFNFYRGIENQSQWSRVFKILCQGKASCRASLADHLNCSMNLRPKAAQNPQSI
jgi:hypothetical protein